ncbi:MAG: class II aldolase/adducin family protein [Proteobacteria bacterium]|nr:class II aldolase/adducin family protein [Pseudomonadota bacterium]HQR04355.1 class II aldolase/adducin family protein [Rhodocyclaceae bacterium]
MSDSAATLLAAARRMNALGISRGRSGNVSVRIDRGFLITPTGMDYPACTPADMVAMDMAGAATGLRAPSSEWRFHRDIYATRESAGAVVHAHAPFATALACMEMPVPPFHYMVARFGGHDVRCASYATFGSQALSDAVLAALEGRCACLMAHHGMVVYGKDLEQALDFAQELETLCEQYWRVLQLGTPRLLDAGEMDRVLEKFRRYGQQSGG